MKNILFCTAILLAMAFTEKQTPRVFLAGDSTMSYKLPQDAPETGWGMVIPEFFDTTALRFENHAVNGRSTKSFRSLGHWDKMMARVQAGDYVFLQFGHNDSKASDTLRYAPAQTAYRANLTQFIAEIRAKGAQPVLLTPVARRKFDSNGKFVDMHGEYPGVVRELAAKQKVPLIDLEQKSRALLEKIGAEDSKSLFMNFAGGIYPKFPEAKEDNTHFSPYGASLVAALVAEGIRESKHPLQEFLKKMAFEGKYAYELPKIDLPVFRKDTFNILNFGAKAGGVTLNTEAIKRAIETCNQRGGGVVLIPAGLWLTGPIRLLSHVNLHLERGCLLQFTDDLREYPLVRSNWEGQDAIRNHHPIFGVDLENVAVTGGGILDGAGDAWRPLKKNKVTESEWKAIVASGGVLNETQDTWYPDASALKGSKMPRPGVIAEGYDEAKSMEVKAFLRPNMVFLQRCKRVLIDGPTFQNSPAWTLHTLLCSHFTLKNVTVKNPAYAQNGDGVDLESTRFFRVENCVFDTGDDGVCLKSGRDEEGRKRGVPTSDGIVQGCTVYKAHGGFVIGSEMSGGVRNIYVSDCTFLGSDIGLRFKTTRGRGGVVEDIFITDINMVDIPSEAILFDMYYNGKAAAEALKNPEMTKLPVTEETPVFRRIYIRNVACRGADYAIFAQGLPEMNVQDIHIENSIFQTKNGFSCVEADGIQLKNIELHTSSNKPALFILNSRNLLFDNVRVNGAGDLDLQMEGKQMGAVQLKNTPLETSRIQLGTSVKPNLLTRN
jgi:DNA sulfur modification protein DndE